MNFRTVAERNSGGKKMRVKMPLRMLLAVGWPLMESHRVGKRGLEQIVVARRRVFSAGG
jgi:hypothetical protein